MITLLEDFPDDVAAFACHGHVTKSDYETVLIPAVDKKLETHDKVRIYYEVAEDFDGFEPGAMWDDTKLGFSKFLRWERFAMVTDVEWIRHTMQFFGFFMPGEFKTFHRAEADAARQWVSEPETVSA